MNDCIFCKIVSGEIPKDFTYQDEYTVAFPDIHPKAAGHTILIPRNHHRWFIDMPDEESDHLFRAAKHVAQILKTGYGSDYVRLGIVGKDVPHVHIHLIPQKIEDDGPEI